MSEELSDEALQRIIEVGTPTNISSQHLHSIAVELKERRACECDVASEMFNALNLFFARFPQDWLMLSPIVEHTSVESREIMRLMRLFEFWKEEQNAKE